MPTWPDSRTLYNRFRLVDGHFLSVSCRYFHCSQPWPSLLSRAFSPRLFTHDGAVLSIHALAQGAWWPRCLSMCRGSERASEREKSAVAILWFEHDLGFEDHPGGLVAAARYRSLVPIFVFDKTLLSRGFDLAHAFYLLSPMPRMKLPGLTSRIAGNFLKCVS